MREYPFYVRYPRWPVDGEAWIHPEDRDEARPLILSDRVFRCDGVEEGYNVLRYGKVRIRVKPALWDEVSGEGFDVGQEVELRSNWGRNEPGLAEICEMFWSPYHGRIRYRVRQNAMDLDRDFSSDDFLPLDEQKRRGRGLP
jgi:hypothetical protein